MKDCPYQICRNPHQCLDKCIESEPLLYKELIEMPDLVEHATLILTGQIIELGQGENGKPSLTVWHHDNINDDDISIFQLTKEQVIEIREGLYEECQITISFVRKEK